MVIGNALRKRKRCFIQYNNPFWNACNTLKKIDAQDREDGTRIFIQLPNEPEYELFASSEDHFYLVASDFEVTFYRNDSGEVDRAVRR